jgi:hypothetical protein
VPSQCDVTVTLDSKAFLAWVATVARASFYHAAPLTRAYPSTSSIRDVVTAAAALRVRLSTAPRQVGTSPVHCPQSHFLVFWGLLFPKSNVSRRAHPANPRPAFLHTKVVIKKMPEAIRQALSAGSVPPYFVFGKTPKYFQT